MKIMEALSVGQLFLNMRSALECGHIASITPLEKTKLLLPTVSSSNRFLVKGLTLSPLLHVCCGFLSGQNLHNYWAC